MHYNAQIKYELEFNFHKIYSKQNSFPTFLLLATSHLHQFSLKLMSWNLIYQQYRREFSNVQRDLITKNNPIQYLLKCQKYLLKICDQSKIIQLYLQNKDKLHHSLPNPHLQILIACFLLNFLLILSIRFFVISTNNWNK